MLGAPEGVGRDEDGALAAARGEGCQRPIRKKNGSRQSMLIILISFNNIHNSNHANN